MNPTPQEIDAACDALSPLQRKAIVNGTWSTPFTSFCMIRLGLLLSMPNYVGALTPLGEAVRAALVDAATSTGIPVDPNLSGPLA